MSEVVKPHLGLITSIAESHTEFLGDIEGVFKEKTSMLKDIEKDGTFIIGYEFEDEDQYENVNLFSDLFEMPLCRDISIKKINLRAGSFSPFFYSHSHTYYTQQFRALHRT